MILMNPCLFQFSMVIAIILGFKSFLFYPKSVDCRDQQIAQKWINFTPLLFIRKISLMLTGILRIGPLVILESILLGISISIYLFEALPLCYVNTLAELAFIVFLIETYASLRMIKKSPKWRKKYVKERIQENKALFYLRLVWDNLNIILIIMVLYSALVSDGMKLSDSLKQISPNSKDSADQQCQYSIFSICLFADLMVKECSFNTEDSMIVWMLYAATTFLISILCILVSKEYYQYCINLGQNRRLLNEYGGLNQTLLNSSIYRISQTTTINEELREQLGVCSICIHEIVEKGQLNNQQKIIKLNCGHHFHQQCIQKWLHVKDHCPYRCFLDQK